MDSQVTTPSRKGGLSRDLWEHVRTNGVFRGVIILEKVNMLTLLLCNFLPCNNLSILWVVRLDFYSCLHEHKVVINYNFVDVM
jgi:hypothetical protein